MNRTILLFYRRPGSPAHLGWRDRTKDALRPAYKFVTRRQALTGFDVSFQMLVAALRSADLDVRINDFQTALQNPTHPVGLVGSTSLVENWTLPNPALLGPSLYDHPGMAPDLMSDNRFGKLLVLADWMKDMFEPYYPGKCEQWFAGFDLANWTDRSTCHKSVDFLVYEKLRWCQHVAHPLLVDPILTRLSELGLSTRILRYGSHHHSQFLNGLNDARAVLFLCEHETQGLAYQEALASNIPVLAWDRGWWGDPIWEWFGTRVSASSVPFFSGECGMRFRGIEDFDSSLQAFLTHRSAYQPRDYVARELSASDSARIYRDAYFSLSLCKESANLDSAV